MSSERTDPFRDLAFNGSPAEYRAFRRKILLSVASLEPKSLRYAGPKILTRLVGEAWRATEHLAISEVRGDDGWLVVLKALDQHYKFLPETELNECVDEFLFHLRRRPNEGATAFTSRFRATLSRLETLIAADKASKKRKRKKKDAPTSSSTSSQSSAPSKASSFSSMQGDVRETASASAGVEKKEKEERRKDKKGSPAPSFTSPAGSRHKRPGSPGSEVSRKSKDSGYGSHKAEEDKAQRVMMRQLGRLEAGHLKLRPVFPSVVLGHLYMKKYGLTREQRTLVVRATGGSSRFEDVERIMRASDFEDRRGEASRAQRPIRKEGVLEADLESPSMSEPLVGSSGDEAFEADFDTEDDEATAAMQDAFEMQKQAKANVKKHFRTYKESRKKIREIKKSRQPYMPVVAIPPEDAGLGSAAATQGTMQPTFKYDRKQRTRQEPQRGGRARKEEVHMLNTVTMTEFSYMITEEAFENSGDSDLQEEPTSGPRLEVDVYLASVPQGYAVIDTGCTSSVIGAETAKRLSQFLMDRGIQGPESLTLPPVQLRGFNGARTTSSQGLKWLVQLGNLWGTVTTYVIPGEAPFLLSRKVLEGMEASLDLGAMTITSQKHGIAKWPLQQAANGHLLMPLVLDKPELEVAKLDEDAVSEPQVPEGQIPDTLSPNLRTNSQGNKQSVKKKQWFQTIMKRTRRCVVDVSSLQNELQGLFGPEVCAALCAYRPKFERIPEQAHTHQLQRAVATLTPKGSLTVTAWEDRPAGKRRQAYEADGTCIFAFRPFRRSHTSPSPQEPPASNHPSLPQIPEPNSIPEPAEPAPTLQAETLSAECVREDCPESRDLEALYEDVDWVQLQDASTESHSRALIARQVDSVCRVPFQLALSALREEPDRVKEELRDWLGDQFQVVQGGSQVDLIEVFAGKAPLSACSERLREGASVRIGLQYGQDLRRARDRRLLILLIGWCKPRDVWVSWPCKYWSSYSRLNMARSETLRKSILSQRATEMVFLRLFEQIWRLQGILGGHAHGENPSGSEACKHILVGPAYEANFHMCALGLRHPVSQLPLRKPTRVLTTDCLLASRLSQCMCPGHQEHACLEGQYKGKSLSAWAETYTESFCKAVCQSFARRDPEVHVIEDVFVESEAEADSEREDEADAPRERPVAGAANYKAMVQKLHVNTGHASVPQMLRLAKRACAPPAVVEAVRQFRCHVCQELQVPPSHRVAALQHTESPNHIVGLDVVQVELKRDSHEGVQEEKFNVLTAVDYATDFAQQIVLPNRPHSISQAFHSLWCRPYGPPKVVYVDPDQRWLSDEFQRFLEQHGITLLSCATESHWQLGRVEIAQRILRNMAQRTWRSTHRPATEVIETCASVRNEQLRKHGFSSSQWFLGREPRVPGALSDLHERNNLATQDAVLSQTDFAQKMHCRQQAAHAFIEAHAHETWTRAIRGRNRPMRGPYVVGQSVYVFRRAGRGLLSTRHGVWKGPGKVVGTESFREDSPVPRVIWVVVNGMMYKCSPETLRPVLEDELAFRELARQYEFGRVPPELDETQPVYGGPAGRYFDLTQAPPEPADFNLQSDAAPLAAPDLAHDPEPPATRRRVTRDSAYWQGRADDVSSGLLPPLASPRPLPQTGGRAQEPSC